MHLNIYEKWMDEALKEAQKSLATKDIPVGAVIADSSTLEIVSYGHNTKELDKDICAHAEINAIKFLAKQKGSYILRGFTLITTLEPCLICAGAIIDSYIDKVIFGAFDEKAGAAGGAFDILRHRLVKHRPEVIGGICQNKCEAVLKEFFNRFLRR